MTKNKKIAVIAASATGVAALVVASVFGVNAYFSDKQVKDTTATAGEVTIAQEQISINNASAYITGNGVDIDMGRYMTTGGAIEGSDGWISEGGSSVSQYNPVWFATFHKNCGGYVVKDSTGFTCEKCQFTSADYDSTSMEQAYLYPNFFRTKDGEVAYCMDNGKIEPSDGICNMSSPVTEEAKRIILTGYPQKSGSEYGISDAELEWCTQIAIYISEGTGYNESGKIVEGNELKLDDFGKYYIPKSNVASANEDKLLEVINKLVDNSKDTSIAADTFSLNSTNVSVSNTKDGYKVGPYKVDTTMSDSIALTASNAGVLFKDIEDKAITSVAANTDFYVLVPTGIEEDVTITVTALSKSIVPAYYYWSGRTSEQKMAVASLMPATITTHISTVGELMPGDVFDVSWVVENLGNKSILTRNRLYLYWDYADGVENANGNESLYVYNQNLASADIQKDMLTKTPSLAGLVSKGEEKEFILNGETHKGFEIVTYGDALDGVGTGAESGDASEVNYSSAYDDNDAIKDVISYKLALSQFANINTSGQKLKLAVITEAMQYRNTNDSDWEQVGYTEVTLGE